MKVHIVKCQKDNYAYVISQIGDNKCLIIDTPEATPILKTLTSLHLKPTDIFNTHHHGDHVAGNLFLKEKFSALIWGAQNDFHRIPGIDFGLEDNQILNLGHSQVQVLFTPGHTHGHIMFHFLNEKILFTGDTLFSMGCGRLFEGTFEQMFLSLQKLRILPDETLIYCGHEYSEQNARFAIQVDPNNTDLKKRYQEVLELRKMALPTVPTSLGLERKINPFLKVASALEFQKLREMRNNF